MTRVVRPAKLEMLRRRVDIVRQLIEDIDQSKILAKLQIEEGDRWGELHDALRAARLPSNPGSVVAVLIALHDALEDQ